jgi:hypothetical protein
MRLRLIDEVVLRALSSGACDPAEVAGRVRLDKDSVLSVLAALERRGLVERVSPERAFAGRRSVGGQYRVVEGSQGGRGSGVRRRSRTMDTDVRQEA